MVIDADVHISPYPQDGGITPDEVIAAMDRACVDKAICWLQPPYMRGIEEATQYVRRAAEKFPERLLPFGWVDPHFPMEECMSLCRRCLYDYDFFGVKFNGAQNSFNMERYEQIAPLIDEIAKAGKVIAFHVGDENNDTHPVKIAEIAKRWPQLNILMVHMGGAASNMENACIEVAAQYSNMYLVGSSVDYPYVLKAIRTLGADRVMFGSDMPFSMMEADAAGYRAFLDAYCTETEKKLVMGGNAVRLLHLKEG